jgi:photosystem II stability/assembly factor-like uncharacterized protein
LLISFPETTTGWVAASHHLLATTDSGDTWTKINLPEKITTITAIALRTPTEGYLLDAQGTLFMTRDAGLTWQAHALALEENETLINHCHLNNIYFSDTEQGTVVFASVENAQAGQTWIARTTDGGRTWQREPLPPIPEIRGTIYYTHLSPDGQTLTLTGTGNKHIAVLHHQAP